MATLIAEEDIKMGAFLSLVGDAFVEDGQIVHRVGRRTAEDIAAWPWIGAAARDIVKGERLSYSPSANTTDIVNKMPVVTTARPPGLL